MRRLTILVIVAACLYSLYWFVGASRIESGAKDALVQMQADGWDISHTDLATRGYPSRFDTTATDLKVAAPDGSWGYSAPFAQAFALSYRPTNVIVALADDQRLQIADQVIDITSNRMRASGSVSAGANLPLKEATFEAEAMALSSNYGWQLDVEDALFALRPSPNEDQTYDLYLGAAKVLPSQGAALLDVKFDSTIQLDRALDRHLSAGASPQIEAIDVKALQVDLGGLQLTGAGRLTVDGAGIPFGEITFNTPDWQKLVPVLSEAGIMPPQFQIMAMTLLQSFAAADGSLSLPLRFENGAMQLGPIPLGPAPRLR